MKSLEHYKVLYKNVNNVQNVTSILDEKRGKFEWKSNKLKKKINI